jgi:hypothetical protein
MAHALRRRGHSLPSARRVLTMNDTVVAIVSAFFIIGIVVGIIAVVAMSAIRAERRSGQDDHAEPYDDPYEPSGPGWDDPDSDPQRRWPGDADSDFSDR